MTAQADKGPDKGQLKKLSLELIVWDPAVEPRLEHSEEVIAEYEVTYRKDKRTMPPIRVIFDGNTYWGFDGRYRSLAAEKAGFKTIDAFVFSGTKSTAIWMAARANLEHGVRMTAADKRKAVMNVLLDKNLVEGYPVNAIADQCGVSWSFVKACLTRLKTEEKEAAEAKKNGKTPPAEKPPEEQELAIQDITPPEPPKKKPPAKKKGKGKKTTKEETDGEGKVVNVERKGKTFQMDTTNIGKNPNSARRRPAKEKLMKAGVVKDRLGHPIPDWLREVAGDSVGFNTTLTCASELVALIEQDSKVASGAGRCLDMKHVVDLVQEIRKHYQAAQFYCACHECREKDGPNKKCPFCGGTGWLTQPEYNKYLATRR